MGERDAGGGSGELDEEEKDTNGVFVMQLLRSVKSCHSLMHSVVGYVITCRIKLLQSMKTSTVCL